jgi:hypothetical protein
MHDGDDADGGGTWMTYRELAAARGITHAAAIRLVQRNRWRKREGSNDGLAHVLVPPDALRASSPVVRLRRTVTPPDTTLPGTPPDTADRVLLAGALAALEGAVTDLHQRTEAAESRVSEANNRADRALALLADAETAMRTERRHTDERLNAAEAEATTLRSVVDRLRSDISRLADRAERAEAEQRRVETRAVLAEADAAEQRTAAEQARGEAHDARQAAEAADSDRRASEIARDEERARVDGLTGLLEATQLELAEQRALTDQADDARAEATQVAEELRRAEETRKARGRLRRAWDGWRGR